MFIVHLLCIYIYTYIIWLWWLTQMQFKVGAFSFITFASLPGSPTPICPAGCQTLSLLILSPRLYLHFVRLSLSHACVYIMYIYIHTIIHIYIHYAWSYHHTSLYAHCCVFHVPFLLVEIGDTPVLCGFIDGFTSSSLGYQNLSMSFHHLAAKNQKMPKNQHKSTSRIFMTTKVNMLFILWMEEILHQLIDGLSHYL